MDRLKEFLSGRPLWQKIAVIITLGVITFISTSCALHVQDLSIKDLQSKVGK